MRRPFSSSAASSSPVDENAVTVKADVEVGGASRRRIRKMHTRPSLDAVGGESKSLPETPRTVVVRCLGGAIGFVRSAQIRSRPTTARRSLPDGSRDRTALRVTSLTQRPLPSNRVQGAHRRPPPAPRPPTTAPRPPTTAPPHPWSMSSSRRRRRAGPGAEGRRRSHAGPSAASDDRRRRKFNIAGAVRTMSGNCGQQSLQLRRLSNKQLHTYARYHTTPPATHGLLNPLA